MVKSNKRTGRLSKLQTGNKQYPLRGEVPSSDEYDRQYSAKQKQKQQQQQQPHSQQVQPHHDEGYDSDHAPPLSQRCSFGLLGRKRSTASSSSSSSSLSKSSPSTAPPSPTPSLCDEIPPLSLPSSSSSSSTSIKYSLRSVIGDGSQQPDGPTVMERRQLRPNGCHLNVSHWSEEGMRSYMEDRYAIEELSALQVQSPLNVSSPTPTSFFPPSQQQQQQQQQQQLQQLQQQCSNQSTWFGVFDGHGGDKASQFCCDRLTSYLTYYQRTSSKSSVSAPSDTIGASLKKAFQAMDHDFVKSGHTDGTTACVCVVLGQRQIVCANAGDSRAIVIRRNGSIARLSRDHKPGVPDETKRISELGGRIVYWGRWRVEGVLAVSRSIGDAALKPYISCEPEICDYVLTDDDLYLVICSDGVWDVLDNLEVADFLLRETRCFDGHGRYRTDKERFKLVARKLCDTASMKGSTDNISVVVVDLKS